MLHVLDDVNVADTDEDSAALRGEIQSALDAGGFAETRGNCARRSTTAIR